MAEMYYHGNVKLLQSISLFDLTYNKNEALQWCFYSPFPSRFLHQALHTRHQEHLELTRFLLNDVSSLIHRNNSRKTTHQFYRGMKLTQELLDHLMNHIGKLICAKGYFTCVKSRATALQMSWSLDHRSDLKPVLFKVICDPNCAFRELVMKDKTTQIVFDVFTPFRITFVNRALVSIVRMEPADDEGRNMARAYRTKHKGENIQQLLDQLATVPNPLVTTIRSLSSVRRSIAQNKIR